MGTVLGIDETINVNAYCYSASTAWKILEYLIQSDVVGTREGDVAVKKLQDNFIVGAGHYDLPDGISDAVSVGDIQIGRLCIRNAVISLWELSTTYCIQLSFKLGDVSRDDWACLGIQIASFCNDVIDISSDVVAAIAGPDGIYDLDWSKRPEWLIYNSLGSALVRITDDGIVLPD